MWENAIVMSWRLVPGRVYPSQAEPQLELAKLDARFVSSQSSSGSASWVK